MKIHLRHGQGSHEVLEGSVISFRWLDGLPDGSLVRRYGLDKNGHVYATMECQKGLWRREGSSELRRGLGSGPWRVVRLGDGTKNTKDTCHENRKM